MHIVIHFEIDGCEKRMMKIRILLTSSDFVFSEACDRENLIISNLYSLVFISDKKNSSGHLKKTATMSMKFES